LGKSLNRWTRGRLYSPCPRPTKVLAGTADHRVFYAVSPFPSPCLDRALPKRPNLRATPSSPQLPAFEKTCEAISLVISIAAVQNDFTVLLNELGPLTLLRGCCPFARSICPPDLSVRCLFFRWIVRLRLFFFFLLIPRSYLRLQWDGFVSSSRLRFSLLDSVLLLPLGIWSSQYPRQLLASVCPGPVSFFPSRYVMVFF